jgi:hypothetical protein
LGSVVFIVCFTARDEALLRDRTAFLADRLGEKLADSDPAALPQWVLDHIPFDGVAWLSLRTATDDTVVRCLHILNHIRTTLARPGAGCVVIVGDGRLSGLALREAADLWSVRSFTLYVEADTAGTEASSLDKPGPQPSADTQSAVDGWRRHAWSPPSLTLPRSLRSPAIIDLIATLNRVYRALPDDPDEADRWLGEAESADGADRGLPGALIALASGYVAAVRGTPDGLAEAFSRAANQAATLRPDPFRLELAVTIFDAATRFGCLTSVTRDAAALALSTAQSLYDQAPTEEASRDLSVSHNRLGDTTRAARDLTTATTHYQAGLDITERLTQADPTNVQWQRDLAYVRDRLASITPATDQRAD